MANSREIRRRIASTGNITQITRAMEMVSAAKMRRAQQRVQASRPYSERLRTMIAGLAGLTDLETGPVSVAGAAPDRARWDHPHHC